MRFWEAKWPKPQTKWQARPHIGGMIPRASVVQLLNSRVTRIGRRLAYREDAGPERTYMGKLKPQQRDQIIHRLQPTGAYLITMAERMQKMDWHATDPFYMHCWNAHEELCRVLIALHYADTGTAWKPPPVPDPDPPLSDSLRNTFRNRVDPQAFTPAAEGAPPPP